MSYKYDFVDKNPYLTYTDEPNMTDADVFGVYSDNPEAAESEGGGGADLGELITLTFIHALPEIGDSAGSVDVVPAAASGVYIGETPVVEVDDHSYMFESAQYAENSVFKSVWFDPEEVVCNATGFYTIEYDGSMKVKAVTEIDVDIATEHDENNLYRFSFVVPEKPSGNLLIGPLIETVE